jgi:phosphatidyl-myo-inositol dimannoside synthase
MRKLLFINLMAFYRTGGLEKFNRCFLKAMNDVCPQLGYEASGMSLCDVDADERYFPDNRYKGFNNKKIPFVFNAIIQSLRQDVLILGHVNTAIIGVVYKTLFPKRKLILICHGIEVWQPLSGLKKKLIDRADKVFAVSEYTRQQIIKHQGKSELSVSVFHNTIDPYFTIPKQFVKNGNLLERYNLKQTDFVIYTLCRLSSKEKYKGYDAVIAAIGKLAEKYPQLKYLIAGKYDDAEKERVDALVADNKLQGRVQYAGYINDDEITDHYQLGDVFVMPSTGEGFGIVFIESMACGRNVIAGNADGSADALRNGELGTIVNAADVDVLANAIEEKIKDRHKFTHEQAASLQKKVMEYFGFDAYRNNLQSLLKPILN